MRLNAVKLLTTVLSLTGTMILSTGCTKSGFSANSLDASLTGDNSSDKLRRRAPASSTTTTTLPPVVTPTPSFAKLQLANLPTASDTNASISYSLVPADPSLVVYCRRDSYEPIACPNPFVLGATTPLSGSHTIDFYVDRGSGINTAAPEISYQWNIVAIAPAPTPATLPPSLTPTTLPPPVVVAPSSAALPALQIYDYEGSGFDLTNWAGQLVTGSTSGPNASDGIARFEKFTNVLGTGKVGYLKRVVQGDAANWSGHRSEVSGINPQFLQLGTDYWFSFAMQPISNEWPGTTGNYSDQQIFFQIHHYIDSNELGPIFSLKRQGGDGSIRAELAYEGLNSSEPTLGPGSNNTLLKVDQWHKFIIHLRFGNSLSYAPRVEVWLDGAKVFDLSGSQAFMGGPNDQGAYWKHGFYFWNGDNGAGEAYAGTPSRAMYQSDLFFGQGASLFNEANSSLFGF